jgi:hypothetical protein
MSTRIPGASPASPHVADTPRNRRPLWIALGIAAVVVVLVVASGVYWLSHPFISGGWYGPGNFQGESSDLLPLSMYMDLSQSIVGGDLTGTGHLCVHESQGVVQGSIKVTGTISGSDITLTVQTGVLDSPNASNLPIPRTLKLHGALVNGTLAFSGVQPQGILTLQSGTTSDFQDSCTSLPTFSPGK